MGAGASGAASQPPPEARPEQPAPPPPEHDPNDKTTWTLQHVFRVFKCYRKGHYDFGLHRAEFVALLQLAAEGATSLVDELWTTFDPSAGGIVNVLEVMAGLAMVSWAPSVRARAELLFTLFDCNNSGEISLDELVILMQSTMAAAVKLSGAGVVPGSAELEDLAAAAFAAADTDNDGGLSRQEFRHWVETGAVAPLLAGLGLGRAVGGLGAGQVPAPVETPADTAAATTAAAETAIAAGGPASDAAGSATSEDAAGSAGAGGELSSAGSTATAPADEAGGLPDKEPWVGAFDEPVAAAAVAADQHIDGAA